MALDRNHLVTLLRRGGLDPEADPMGPYQAFLDPAGAETLGQVLAVALDGPQPAAVMVWRGVSDAILAHVVARELGVSVVLAFDDDGLVQHRGALEAGDPVVLLADRIDDPGGLEAVVAYVEHHGGSVTGLGLLVDDGREPPPGLRVTALLSNS